MRTIAGFLFVILAALVLAAPARAQSPLAEARAPRILMIEASTGTVILSRRAEEPFAPGSLAKLMTVEVVLDALARGEITADASYPVSENAWRSGGAPSGTTTMFAAVRSSVPVADLLRGVIVHNANDACIVLAEGIAGSEDAFTDRMRERAEVLGLAASRFGNATGLPSRESVVTLADLIRLARRIETAYPDYFPFYALPDFEWNRIRQRNKNPMLNAVAGIDGFAAGYAETAGFGLVATARRGDTRLYLAMSGLESDKERREEAVRLFEWAFSGFALRTVFSAGASIGDVKVYGGEAATVGVSAAQDVMAYVPLDAAQSVTAEIVYRGPLRAPVDKGREAGVVRILSGGMVLREAPLFTASTVEAGTLRSRAGDALKALLFAGW